MKNPLIELAKEKARKEKEKAREAKRKSREALLKAKQAAAKQKADEKKWKAESQQREKALAMKITGVANDFLEAYNKLIASSGDLAKTDPVTLVLAKDGNFVGKLETSEGTYYCESFQQKGKTYLKVYHQTEARIDDGDNHYPQYRDGYYVVQYEAVVTQKGAKLSKDVSERHGFYSLTGGWKEEREYKEFRESVIDFIDAKQKMKNDGSKR